MDTTTVHGRSRPELTDGPAQPGITIDDGQHGRSQPARDEILEAALPRRERLAVAQLQREEVLSAVREDADDAEQRYADYSSGASHAQGKAIEVDVGHLQVGEQACPPCLRAVLQHSDDARHRALRKRCGLQ